MFYYISFNLRGSSWWWSYGSWIYNCLCNQCLSPLMLWVRISTRARCTTLCDKVCQWLATDRWFSPGPPVSSTNKTNHHNITEILLKVALNTIKQTNKQQTFNLIYNVIFLVNSAKGHANDDGPVRQVLWLCIWVWLVYCWQVYMCRESGVLCC